MSRCLPRCVTTLPLLCGFAACATDGGTSPEDAPEDGPPAITLACGDVFAGSIDEPGEVDRATFELGDDDLASFTLLQLEGSTPGNINARVILERPTGGVIAGLQERRKLYVGGEPMAEFRLEVLAAADGTGSYQIGFDCIFPPQPLDGELADGGVLNATMDAPVESDQFTFDGIAGDVVTVTTSPRDFLPLTVLFPPSQVAFASRQFGGPLTVTLPETGQYVIQVSDFIVETTGTYWLGLIHWLDLQDAAPIVPVDGTLTCDMPVAGSIVEEGDTDHVRFTGVSDAVDLTLADDGFGVASTVYAPNWPSGFFVFPLSVDTQELLLQPDDGPYLMQVRATDLQGEGTYSISLDC